MSRAGTIARRSFLIGSSAIAGGVAFGAYLASRPLRNPLLEGLKPGEASFNPWVRISDKGITLITPHVDVGQGAVALQALLIAEEMDLDLDQFETSFGEPNAAYYNTAIGDDLAPFWSTDHSRLAQTARGVTGKAAKVLGFQSTGGSSSVPDSFDKLRKAGAVARETLKAAAAVQSGIAAADLTTSNGAVVLPDGTRLTYTALATIAADIDPVQDVSLRGPDQWRLIGKPVQRIDIVPKSIGALVYGIDVKIEGMVHATLKCNPNKQAPLNSFDAGAALAMRGVQDVVAVTGGVCVLADNTWRAFQAAEAVKIDWAPAAYPTEQEGHWAALETALEQERLGWEWRHDGDVPAALSAVNAFETTYRAPYVAHQPLEPMSAIVRVMEDRVDIWASHQIPRTVEQRVAAITDVDAANVHLHNQFAGGSFGQRLEFEFIDRTAEAAAQVKGTPVKMTLRREEDFIQDFPRHIAMARVRGAVAEGQVTTCDLSIAAPAVIREQSLRVGIPLLLPDKAIVDGAANMPYAIPNLRVAGYEVAGLAPVSSWRSVGASAAGFFAEGFLDELIHAAGADPMLERLRLVNDTGARAVLEAVSEMSNWGSDPGPGRGRGVAMVHSFGVPVAEVVEVTQTGEGIRIDKVFVAADVGRVVDPVNFENLVQGGVIWGLGHAINSQITYSGGAAQQDNYHAAEGLRFYQTPQIEVRGLELAAKIRGIGEPPVPPAAPALANAIFAATGHRLREMPFNQHIAFA